MSEFETQLVLAAFRPDGSDRGDPLVDAALQAAARDPDLQARFESAREFDARFASALARVPIPADLRANILAGARFADQSSSGGTRYRPVLVVALAAAACLAVAAIITQFYPSTDPEVAPAPQDARPEWEERAFALLDSVTTGHTAFELVAPSEAEARMWFADITGRDEVLPPSLAGMPSVGCKHVQTPEGSVALMCFHTESGDLVHLSVWTPPPGSEAPDTGDSGGRYAIRGKWDSVAWDGENGLRYMLATQHQEGSREQLRQLVPEGIVG